MAESTKRRARKIASETKEHNWERFENPAFGGSDKRTAEDIGDVYADSPRKDQRKYTKRALRMKDREKESDKQYSKSELSAVRKNTKKMKNKYLKNQGSVADLAHGRAKVVSRAIEK